MKRVLGALIGLFCVLPALAVVRPDQQLPRAARTFAPLANYSTGGEEGINKRYLMPKMMRGEPLRISMQWGDFTYLPHEDMQRIIARAYEKWFLQTAEHIRKAKRTAEFADVLPVLDKGVKVEFVTQNPDIEIRFVPLAEIRQSMGQDSTLGYYTQKNVPVPTIFVPQDWAAQKGNSKNPKKLAKFYATLLVHEIGHSIGFADTYEGGRLASDQLYGTEHIYPSVMDSMHYSYKEENLSCDDATGVINLMDITRNYTSRGGETGWHSLCPKSKEYFIHNISGARGLYKVEHAGDGVLVSKAEKGQIVRRKYPRAQQMYTPLDNLVLANPQEYDALKRVVRGKTASGDDVFVNYLYESRTLAVVRNGKVIYYRQDLPTKREGSETWWISRQGDRLELWELKVHKKTRELTIYTDRYNPQHKKWEASGIAYRKYDKKGNLLESRRKEDAPKPQNDNTTAAQKSSAKPKDDNRSFAQAVDEQTTSAQLDQFVKDFKINAKAKNGALVL